MSYRVCVGQQPGITTFSSVGTIFVGIPNESIFNGGIELNMHVVNKFRSLKREVGVQNLKMRVIGG